MKLEKLVWYQTLDWSMIWVCLIAVVVHLLYLEINKNAVKYTWKNYLFYVLSAILVLSFISEIAGYMISNYTNISIDLAEGINHVLAAISGLGGGYITTNIIKRIESKIE